MKYLLFDENAISKYVSVNVLQSIEYTQSQRFIEHICGSLSSELIYDTAVEYCDDGVLFIGRKDNSASTTDNRKILCIDLTTCDLLNEKERPSDLLTVIQRTFRVCLRIWNHLPFSASERYNGSKSIVFPFVMPDKRRIVIERSSTVLNMERRGIDFPLLAYKYGIDEAPSGEEKVNSAVLKAAAREYAAKFHVVQTKFKNTEKAMIDAITDASLDSIETREINERRDFIYWDFSKQYENLTETQKKVVDHTALNTPLRVEGVAGTGKTASLIMRAYKLLEDQRIANKALSQKMCK